MQARRIAPRIVAAVALFALVCGQSAAAQTANDPPAVPRAVCGPGSDPETGRQGRVPSSDHASGRTNRPYTCNTQLLGHFGTTGGYKVHRYVDAAGHECAFYDTTLLFPTDVPTTNLNGTFVLDMKDPTNPVKTANLLTPAMQSPHESLNFNAKRGLLVAALANPVAYPGVVDIYDVKDDCRTPKLLSSLPVGLLAHESGFAPDGNTFYVASLDAGTLTAVDVSDPLVPKPLWTTDAYKPHGLSVSDDGNRAYVAARTGLVVLDTSQIQNRTPNPVVPEVSALTWPTMSTPQITIPITVGGKPFMIEMDEFAKSDPIRVGAARIIDMADEKKPKVISDIKLEVHLAENRNADQDADPGATTTFKGYAGHYCEVPRRVDPGVVACTFILSGMRLFDIRDPYHPKEIAYFNGPIPPTKPYTGGAYAMSSPVLIPERGELWYSDGVSGFYAVKVTNGVWPSTSPASAGGAPGVAGSGGTTGGGAGNLPATGRDAWLPAAGAASLVLLLALRRARRRER
jgi:hypothetical protein